MTIEKKLICETVTPHYFLRVEDWTHPGDPGPGPTRMRVAYTFAGDYIGEPDHAGQLIRELGITHFEKTAPEHCVCSIGFSPRDQKWYGWSHRAIQGYGIGDVVEAGTVPVTDVEAGGEAYEGIHPGFKIETFDEAKRVATAFARSVS